MIRFTREKKGFVIFYAVLVTGIVLTVSLLVADILTRQIIISSIGKNYQYAYYAANTGRECSKYYYFNRAGELFGTVVNDQGTRKYEIPSTDDANLTFNNTNLCAVNGKVKLGLYPNETVFDKDEYEGKTTKYKLEILDEENRCSSYALVTVRINPTERLFIESKGYNTCTDNPRKVQAVTEFKYSPGTP